MIRILCMLLTGHFCPVASQGREGHGGALPPRDCLCPPQKVQCPPSKDAQISAFFGAPPPLEIIPSRFSPGYATAFAHTQYSHATIIIAILSIHHYYKSHTQSLHFYNRFRVACTNLYLISNQKFIMILIHVLYIYYVARFDTFIISTLLNDLFIISTLSSDFIVIPIVCLFFFFCFFWHLLVILIILIHINYLWCQTKFEWFVLCYKINKMLVFSSSPNSCLII